MPNSNNLNAGNHRFGFNGKEVDGEVSGNGNSYDYGFRIYNPRLGRFLSEDPLLSSYPMLTPYQFAGNRPIDGIDMDGFEYLRYSVLYFRDVSKIANNIETEFDGIVGSLHRQNLRDRYPNIFKVYTWTGYGTYTPPKRPKGKGTLSTPNEIVFTKVKQNVIQHQRRFNKKTRKYYTVTKGLGKKHVARITSNPNAGVAGANAIAMGIEMMKTNVGQNAKIEYSSFEQMDLKYFNRTITVVENGIDLGLIPSSYQTGDKVAELLNAILSEEEFNKASPLTRELATYLYDNANTIIQGIDPTKDRMHVGPDDLGVGVRVTVTLGNKLPTTLIRLFTPKKINFGAPRFY